MSLNIIETEDGSHTLYNDTFHEVYHSKYGAISESMHVFIKSGLNKLSNNKSIEILEIGMGTGLNTLLTFFQNPNQMIRYTALEPFPLDEEYIKKLNYPNIIKKNQADIVFKRIHSSDWETWIHFDTNFEFRKIRTTLQHADFPSNNYNLVYFDAFSPDIQPELWTEKQFEKIISCMKNNGILVTYSAKGSVKRAMKAAGFQIEKIPGPKGKREMLRGIKIID